MSKSELHDWENAIERLNNEMLNIARDIYKTAFVRGKNCMALEQEPRWIPVNEELPKPQKDNDDFSDWVLVSVKMDLYHSVVCSARYCFYTKRWCAERGGYCFVEAWQPLPEPYKAESEKRGIR